MSDLREALAELYEWCRGLNDFRPDSNLARRVQSALSAQPQPEAVGAVKLPVSAHWLGDREAASNTRHAVDERGCVLYFTDQADCIAFMQMLTVGRTPLAPDERMRKALERELTDCQSAVDTIEHHRDTSNETQNGNYRFYQGRVVSLKFALEALSRAHDGKESETRYMRHTYTFNEPDEAEIRVEDSPRSHGESLQQGPDTSSNPSTAVSPHGKGSAAANVANPVASSDLLVSHEAPVSSDPTPAPAVDVEARDLLSWLDEHRNCELSYDGWEDNVWSVHAVNGGRNDRQWRLIATGSTAMEALSAARLSLPDAERAR